mgnify:CR=1 FL=1
MKRNGQIIAEQALRIAELEKELAEADKIADMRVAKVQHLREYWYSVSKKQEKDLALVRHENVRLQAKLALRSRKLGEARKQADQWHTAWEDAERAHRALSTDAECTAVDDAVRLRGENDKLWSQNEILRRVALIHFTHDELARELDGVKA